MKFLCLDFEWAYEVDELIVCALKPYVGPAVFYYGDIITESHIYSKSCGGSSLHWITAEHLYHDLQDYVNDGYTIITYDGVLNDFHALWHYVLKEEEKPLAVMAENSVDIATIMRNAMGRNPKLNDIFSGMGIAKKPLISSDIGDLWTHGHYQDIFDYLFTDINSFHAVVEQILGTGVIRWANTMPGVCDSLDIGLDGLKPYVDVCNVDEYERSWLNECS